MRISDWSSDVCSSDLKPLLVLVGMGLRQQREHRRGRARHPHVAMHQQVAFRAVGARRLQVGAEAEDRRHVVRRGRDAAGRRLDDVVEMQRGAVMAAVTLEGIDLRRSEEHTSELQSLMRISYAVFCLKKKKQVQ